MDLRVVSPGAEPAQRLMSDYLDELGVRQAGSFDRARYVDADPAEFEPPPARSWWHLTASRRWHAAACA